MSVSARLVQLTSSGDEEPSLLEVSLYPVQTVTKSSSCPLMESQRCKLGRSSVSKVGMKTPPQLEVLPYHYLNVLSKRAKYDYF